MPRLRFCLLHKWGQLLAQYDMNALTFLRHADFFATIAVNSIVLCFSFTAYRRTGMRAFAFWIVGCVICIISSVGLHAYGYSRTLAPEDYRRFMEFYRIGYLIQAALSGAGSVMIIRYVLAKLDADAAPNKPFQPTATMLSTPDRPDNAKRRDPTAPSPGGSD